MVESMFDTLDEAALVEEISRLERVKSAAAAGQARAAAALDALRRAAEAAAGVPRAKQGRGVGSEVALARRDSPARGGRHLGFATALVHEMPHTLAALECGVLSEWRATLIVRESACLDVEDRRTLDAELCGDPATLEGKGDARIAADAKAIAYRLDPHAVVDRAARAETERTVTVRPAPDSMTYVTALLPVAQGVGVYAAFKRAADTSFDGRSRGQVMADTLVERVTGRPAEVPDPVAVNLVISDETLLGADDEPGSGGRLRAHPGGGGPRAGHCCGRRQAFAGDIAAALSPAHQRRLGGHGVTLALFPERAGRLHRAARSDLPHPLLRRADPPPRPRPTPLPRRAHQRPTTDCGDCERCNYTKESPAGASPPATTKTVSTPPNSRPRPATATAPPHHQHPGPSRSTSAEIETRIGIAIAQAA